MRSQRTESSGRLAWRIGLAITGCALFGALSIGATTAQALPEYDFTPDTTPDTLFKSSTAPAGANPELTFTMVKPRTGCYLWDEQIPPPSQPPFPQNCRTVDREENDYFYEQQNLKKQVVTFPPGLLPNVNAAPYCNMREWWLPSDDMPGFEGGPLFVCANLGAQIGTVTVYTYYCWKGEDGGTPGGGRASCLIGQEFKDPEKRGYGAFIKFRGFVYNERPRPGENGRLVALLPQENEQGNTDPSLPTYVRVDLSVRVRESDLGVTTVADNIPDVLTMGTRRIGCPTPDCLTFSRAPSQVDDMELTIDGRKGAERGRALLTNPTTCDRQTIGIEFQGYARNAFDPPSRPAFPETPVKPGSGEGKTVKGSVPYQTTGCDKVPYDPQINLAFDTTDSQRVPAVKAVITQKPNEQTTGRVETVFDKGVTMNLENKVRHCTEADVAKCTDASRIGTATAESHLLLENQKALTGDEPKFAGPVYLAGLKGDEVRVRAVLKGVVGAGALSLNLDGTGKLLPDSRMQVVFDNPYKVPINRFTLDLLGGRDKGILKNPTICATKGVTNKFVSHAGKVVERRQEIAFKGCKTPSFDVNLSSTAPGKPTTVEAKLGSVGTRIDPNSIRIGFPPELALATRKSKRPSSAITSDGKITVTTADGELSQSLVFIGGDTGAVQLVPFSSSAGTLDLSRALVTTEARKAKKSKKRRKAGTRKRKKSKKKSGARGKRIQSLGTGSGVLALSGLPDKDTTAVELSLGSSLRPLTFINPDKCDLVLHFSATVKTKDGKTLDLSDDVRLEPCAKQRASGKKKHSGKKRGKRHGKR